MPLNSVHTALKQILDGLVIPGTAGTLDAYIMPPDPRDEPPPAIYLYPARGPEKRQALPRNQTEGINSSQAGWKQIDHTVDGYLTWFCENDPAAQVDSAFPAVIDAVMAALREGPSPYYVTDPLTGLQSDLVDIGERMEYDAVAPRTTSAEALLRFDALITIHVLEFFQA
jgi:hypothetical protein